MPPRTLVLFAHPAVRRSRVNRVLATAARSVDGVTFHDLYETYPDFSIDVDREQALLVAHDVIVLQHPFYWYSVPALLKEWMDLVLEYGFAYGENGRMLMGKAWMHAITTGGRDTNYGPGSLNAYTVDELLRPLEATARLCRMRWIQPFLVQGTFGFGEREIGEAVEAYRARLTTLSTDIAALV